MDIFESDKNKKCISCRKPHNTYHKGSNIKSPLCLKCINKRNNKNAK